MNFLIHKNEFMIENKSFFLWFWLFWFCVCWLKEEKDDELFSISFSYSDSSEDLKWLFLLKEEEVELDFDDLMRWKGNSSIVVKIYFAFFGWYFVIDLWLIVDMKKDLPHLISHSLPYLIKPSHQKQNNIKKTKITINKLRNEIKKQQFLHPMLYLKFLICSLKMMKGKMSERDERKWEDEWDEEIWFWLIRYWKEMRLDFHSINLKNLRGDDG